MTRPISNMSDYFCFSLNVVALRMPVTGTASLGTDRLSAGRSRRAAAEIRITVITPRMLTSTKRSV